MLWTLLLSLASTASAGLVVPLPIINYSPFNITIDMDQDSRCMKIDNYDDTYLSRYYRSYKRGDLTRFGNQYSEFNTQLTVFKTRMMAPDLSIRRARMKGKHTLRPIVVNATATDMITFEAETDASIFKCHGRYSWKQFKIGIEGGHSTLFEIRDPSDSSWEMAKFQASGRYNINIGPGGHLATGTVVGAVGTLGAVIASAAAFKAVAAGALLYGTSKALGFTSAFYFFPNAKALIIKYFVFGGVSFGVGAGSGGTAIMAAVTDTLHGGRLDRHSAAPDVTPTILGWNDIYEKIPVDQRSACIIGRKTAFYYDCWGASTALVVQADGSVIALPLPSVDRAWDS